MKLNNKKMQDLEDSKLGLFLGLTGFLELFLFLFSVLILKRFVLENFFSLFIVLEPFIIYSAWIFDLAGLFFGLMGLRTKNRKYAKISILLSISGLLEYVLLYYSLALLFGMAS